MTHHLTEETVEQIRGHFNDFDTDHNGYIDLEEFAKLLHILAPDADEAEVQRGFETIDENRDGHIDFNEFIAWWRLNWFVF